MLRRARGFVRVAGITTGTPDLVVGSMLTLQLVGPLRGRRLLRHPGCHTYDLAHGLAHPVRGRAPDRQRGGVMTRPTPSTASAPGFFGVYPALVTDLVETGRRRAGQVQVSFPWLGKDGDRDVRAWATLCSPYADDDQGLEILPEVAARSWSPSRRGNLRRPYIVGSCWNGKARLPARRREGQQHRVLKIARQEPAGVRRQRGRRQGHAEHHVGAQGGAGRRRQLDHGPPLRRVGHHDRVDRHHHHRHHDVRPGQGPEGGRDGADVDLLGGREGPVGHRRLVRGVARVQPRRREPAVSTGFALRAPWYVREREDFDLRDPRAVHPTIQMYDSTDFIDRIVRDPGTRCSSATTTGGATRCRSRAEVQGPGSCGSSSTGSCARTCASSTSRFTAASTSSSSRSSATSPACPGQGPRRHLRHVGHASPAHRRARSAQCRRRLAHRTRGRTGGAAPERPLRAARHRLRRPAVADHGRAERLHRGPRRPDRRSSTREPRSRPGSSAPEADGGQSRQTRWWAPSRSRARRSCRCAGSHPVTGARDGPDAFAVVRPRADVLGRPRDRPGRPVQIKLDDQEIYQVRCVVTEPPPAGMEHCPPAIRQRADASRSASRPRPTPTARRTTRHRSPRRTCAGWRPGPASRRDPVVCGSSPRRARGWGRSTSGRSRAPSWHGRRGRAICTFAFELFFIVALFLFLLFLPIVVLLFQLWWMLALGSASRRRPRSRPSRPSWPPTPWRTSPPSPPSRPTRTSRQTSMTSWA